MTPPDFSAVDSRIEECLEFWLDRLATLVNQPSISSQDIGMEQCANLVEQILSESGFDCRLMSTDGYPVVYAEAAGASDQTLLCYNHYDVQPPEPLELWQSPPFEATRRDGKIFGRGVQDDKGQLISRLAALTAIRDATGDLPCRIKFMIEGGEEIGSPFVPEFVTDNADLLSADGCVWEFGGVEYDGRPGLILGLRGLCYVELHARTMSRDAHSGLGHLLPNAAWRLIRALSTIKDENEHIMIDGFYEHVREPNEVELRLLEDLPDDDDEIQRNYGVDAFLRGLHGFSARRAVFTPTANIAGFSSGYEGPGSKTVIPSTAMVKMDFRLVPDQDPIEIFHKLRDHLDRHGFQDIEVKMLGGERPGVTPSDDPLVGLAAETAEEVYESPPHISPLNGGSGPVAPFRDVLNVPIVTLGAGYPEAGAHAPNENMRIEDFLLATKHMARLAVRFPSLETQT
jgi:acetylornithine deacetylase/succinyl-diaminopimelate desuccinylase-like protein